MAIPSASATNVEVTYKNEFIEVEFSGMQEFVVDSKNERSFTRDPVTNTLTDLGSSTATEPTEISITLDSSCGNPATNSNLVDILAIEFERSTRESFSRGTLTIVDKNNGYVRTYGAAVISKNPFDTTYSRGTQATYSIMFKCGREEINT